jgi:Zn-dependent protease
MENLLTGPISWATLLYLPALLVGYMVHELAHAAVAFALGDTSQVEQHRLSFNPLRHVSWLGMALFLLVGLPWAKPLRAEPSRFRMNNKALGMFLVSVAGVSANFLVALVALVGIMGTAIVVSVTTGSGVWDIYLYLTDLEPGLDLQGAAVALSTYLVAVNVGLALFNLLPLPLFDGFQALLSLFAAVRVALKPEEGFPTPAWLSPASRPAWMSAPGVASNGGDDEAEFSAAQLHFSIGLDYHKEGQLDEAIARYRQAIANDAGFSLAYYNQGLAYMAKGRPSLATSSFRAAVRTGRDPGVRLEADRRLRELAQAEQDPAQAIPIPPPLEEGAEPQPGPSGPPDVDPDQARRVWLRLATGVTVMVVLGSVAWLFVTMAVWSAVL